MQNGFKSSEQISILLRGIPMRKGNSGFLYAIGRVYHGVDMHYDNSVGSGRLLGNNFSCGSQPISNKC